MLLLVPQFKKLLLVQVGETGKGFHLLLLIFKTEKKILCAYIHIATFVNFFTGLSSYLTVLRIAASNYPTRL